LRQVSRLLAGGLFWGIHQGQQVFSFQSTIAMESFRREDIVAAHVFQYCLPAQALVNSATQGSLTGPRTYETGGRALKCMQM
jgi:hypothetical protein